MFQFSAILAVSFREKNHLMILYHFFQIPFHIVLTASSDSIKLQLKWIKIINLPSASLFLFSQINGFIIFYLLVQKNIE